MRYVHTPRFQALMHSALRMQTISELADDSGQLVSYTAAALAEFSSVRVSTINAFLTQKNVPRFDDGKIEDMPIDICSWKIPKESESRKLWDYLSRNGMISKVVNTGGIQKHRLFSHRSAATTLMAFFDANERNIVRFSRNGLTEVNGTKTGGTQKTWVGFKFSTRRPGFVIKSEFTIKNFQDEHFLVEESQESSGKTEDSGERFTERSTGFGFIKTDRLWCYLREADFFQPRIFAFDKFISPAPKEIKFLTSGNYSTIYGHVSEGDKKYTRGFYPLNVVLMDIKHFREEFSRKFKDVPFKLDNHIDSVPFLDRHKKRYGNNPVFFVPPYVGDYLLRGFRPWNTEET